METVGIIGAGRLGGCLAKALSDAGYGVTYVASEDAARAEDIAGMTGAKVIGPPYSELTEVDGIFLTVPDQVIRRVAEILAGSIIDWRGKCVFHCSGIYSAGILSPLKERGAKTLSFHPLQTFTLKVEPERLRGIYFGVEGEDIVEGMKLAERLGGRGIEIKEQYRSLYHAGASTASNYLYGILMAAVEMLEGAGISREEAAQMLLPLVKGTIDNFREYGTYEGLTGPIVRGDGETVEKHLKALEEYPDKSELYKSMGLFLLEKVDLGSGEKDKFFRLLSGIKKF